MEKPPGDHDELTLLDGLCQHICGLNNNLRCQVTLLTNVVGSAPARPKSARNVVLSPKLLPGNTRMMTRVGEQVR